MIIYYHPLFGFQYFFVPMAPAPKRKGDKANDWQRRVDYRYRGKK